MRKLIAASLAAIAVAPIMLAAPPASAKPVYVCDGPTRHAYDSHKFTWTTTAGKRHVTVKMDTKWQYCHPDGAFYSSRGYAARKSLVVTTNVERAHESCDWRDIYEGITFKMVYSQPWTARRHNLPELTLHCEKDTVTELHYNLRGTKPFKWVKGYSPLWDARVQVHLDGGVEDKVRHLSGSFER